MDFSKAFGFGKNEAISVIGSGGKTTLCYRLVKENENKRLAFTTTTKIFPPTKEILGVERFYDFFGKNLPNSLKVGVNLFGEFFQTDIIKISSLDFKELKTLHKLSDMLIYEADGAKCKPLKAWNGYEPVVLDFTSTVIGVLPLYVHGEKVHETLIHRYERFCDQFRVKEGQNIGEELFLKIIKEMFKKVPTNSRKILFFNRYDFKRDFNTVGQIAENLNHIEFFAGSLKNGNIERIL